MTDILDPDYESDLTEKEHNQLVLMSEHAILLPLSPAAKSVLIAEAKSRCLRENRGCYSDDDDWNGCWVCVHRRGLAAALRAAVAHTQEHHGHGVWKCDADELLSIAAELEAL
jgi:hypothetical protein